MIACTIVARNYLGFARVLARSYSAHHRGERMSVLVIDGEVGPPLDASGEPFDLVRPSELSLSAAEYRQMATIYEVTELATAVKPSLLQLLLGRGADAAVYLDPDIEVFAPLDDLGELARRHGIVLIPHALAPLPADGRKPTPQDIADAGVYNLGFIAVGPQAGPFLEWWAQRLRRDCIVSVEEGLFVDQRLLDALPAYFEHTILRDPGCDVAYWNLHERSVRWTGSRYEVAGAPLRFFHFSGFDPRRPDVLSKHQGDRPRTVLGSAPDLARLCREYAAKLLAAGHREAAAQPYGFARTAAGLVLDRRMRRLYREALLAADRGAPLDAPDPFDPETADAFADWLGEPTRLSALTAGQRAALAVASEPRIGSPNPLVRIVQRTMLRAMRPLVDHQRLVAQALLAAIAERDKKPDVGQRSDSSVADERQLDPGPSRL